MNKRLAILGTRGVPAAHGGFETFAEALAVFLVEKGWDVVVYCQVDKASEAGDDEWRGIKRVRIHAGSGALGTIKFDFKATIHSMRFSGVVLTLGYNTAIFCLFYRLFSTPNVINMDGIEWKRKKWSPWARAWLLVNEYIGAKIGNHLVADHPGIKRHLEKYVDSSKVTMIPYGANPVKSADESVLTEFDIVAYDYAVLIARPEPENSILEVVSGWSRRPRKIKLVVLGNYISTNEYHREVLEAASGDVKFVGAIYDKNIVEALRFFAIFYIHGHQVGGTNPSLVEALGAGNAIIAHDNQFNRWVAGESAKYFKDAKDISDLIERLESDLQDVAQMQRAARARHGDAFQWGSVLLQYERLLEKYI